jgi:hypothetical protein
MFARVLRRLSAELALELRADAREVVGMYERLHRREARRELVERISQHGREALAVLHVAGGDVPVPEAVVAAVEHALQPRLTLAQPFLGGAALGDLSAQLELHHDLSRKRAQRVRLFVRERARAAVDHR